MFDDFKNLSLDEIRSSLEVEDSDEPLIHFGVKGMKWGIRRKIINRQESIAADSPKEAARLRAKAAKLREQGNEKAAKELEKYAAEEDEAAKSFAKAAKENRARLDAEIKAHEEAQANKPKNKVKTLSDAELKKLNQRMEAEQRYLSLLDKQNEANRSNVQKGLSMVSGILVSSGKEVAKNLVTQQLTVLAQSAVPAPPKKNQNK